MRTRRSQEDDVLNAKIGRRLAALRTGQGLSLRDLAERVGMSPTHLNALESGKHAFSAALIIKLSSIFGEPVNALLGSGTPRDDLFREWRMLFDGLHRRDRLVLVDLARKLTQWSRTFDMQTSLRSRRHTGVLVSVEGIDGVLLHRIAHELGTQLGDETSWRFVSYDQESELWQHMRDRFRDLSSSHHPALERTLLFACERLQRQEVVIRPALAAHEVVFTPFFIMAPSVYQEADGIADRRVIELIETLLIQPDIIIIVHSSPEEAQRKATLDIPGEDQFYSPYVHVAEFRRALALHGKAGQEFTASGYRVREIDVREGTDSLRDIVEEILEFLR